MKTALILLVLALFMPAHMQDIYHFLPSSDLRAWRIVNDGVMGGVSTSTLTRTAAGHGQFSGHVSLANNGGFASVQLNTAIQVAEAKTCVVLRVKGDGKRYEFRLKGDLSQGASYVHPFATSGEWETLQLKLSDFYPQFRGQRLNLPNFHFDRIAQLGFLIANKQEEDFRLWVDWIGLV